MSDNTNIADLQAQIAELKAQKELRELQEEAAQAEAPKVEVETEAPKATEWSRERMEHQHDIESARVRGWAYFVGSYCTGPIWPGIVAARTNVWAPFWVGLGLGVASLPLAFLDWGIITSIPAAAAGTAMMSKKSEEKRRKLGIACPEQADMMRFQKF